MKYKAVVQKLLDKEKSLTKAKKELVPLKISLSQRSFNELQEDIVLTEKTLLPEYTIQATTDKDVYTLKHMSAALTAEIHIT